MCLELEQKAFSPGGDATDARSNEADVEKHQLVVGTADESPVETRVTS